MSATLFSEADALQAWCLTQDWRFCFIGGLAVQHWGRPRVTDDIDVTLLTGFGGEERFAEALLRRYAARVEEPMAFALRNRVMLLKTADGFGIDIAFGGLAFEEAAVNRATMVSLIPGTELNLCSAEDLVVMKSFAGRPIDWMDVESVIVRQQGKLDWGYIYSQLEPLAALKESPELVTQLRVLEKRSRSGRLRM
ncbi:MAG: hypothetical protein EXS37_19365 [Opitutus sp.]|nr:hypothetical protein [Opitutus sp.]